ncbi:hypothetical protein CYMTET_53909 [Cymbomonas tetramitiformis]|uniref:Uncharacterized protein n=1 Tax=Cymbomonas tetramitiformis TaxID=36881 RepID=A0AAE0ER96_9CHLO|nr:hypothetical protein CYMTET_53909 [Cymbomonas tetramitiformis]
MCTGIRSPSRPDVTFLAHAVSAPQQPAAPTVLAPANPDPQQPCAPEFAAQVAPTFLAHAVSAPQQPAAPTVLAPANPDPQQPSAPAFAAQVAPTFLAHAVSAPQQPAAPTVSDPIVPLQPTVLAAAPAASAPIAPQQQQAATTDLAPAASAPIAPQQQPAAPTVLAPAVSAPIVPQQPAAPTVVVPTNPYPQPPAAPSFAAPIAPQQQPAAPTVLAHAVSAPITPQLFRSGPRKGLGDLLKVIVSPAQSGPTAPKKMKIPDVVKESNIRVGKQRIETGPAVSTIIKAHRVGKGKTELLKSVQSSMYNKYGEWAGQDSDSGLSIPVKVCKMVVDFSPTIDDGLPFWRPPIIAVNTYTIRLLNVPVEPIPSVTSVTAWLRTVDALSWTRM